MSRLPTGPQATKLPGNDLVQTRLNAILTSGIVLTVVGYFCVRGMVTRSGIPEDNPPQGSRGSALEKTEQPAITILRWDDKIADVEKFSITGSMGRLNDDAVVIHRESGRWVCEGQELPAPDIAIGLRGILAQRNAHQLFVLGRKSDAFGTMVKAADQCRKLPLVVIYLVQCDYGPTNFQGPESPTREPF